jgi:hypothetical protein
MQPKMPDSSGDDSSDSDDRIEDFFSRHGGPGRRPSRTGVEPADCGWSEVYAADGHILRCEWRRSGTRKEFTYTELSPTARQDSDDRE